MSLRTEFQGLNAQLESLHEALSGLRTAIDDRPPQGASVMLLDSLGDAVEDTLGWLEEALGLVAPLAEEPAEKGGAGFDVGRARQAIVFAQEQFNRITGRFMFDLTSYENVSQLMQLGRERRGEWQAWAAAVKADLERCQQHLYDTGQALFRCWLEIAERVGMTSVSVQATTIGQQITVPQNQEQQAEGMT
ncbi:MAG TPA: hypothetical protein VD861_03175 [Pyrinomonadaceae bacterium]|nr:hypothetical protein [Pyrinomonadaceae bacterium]